MKHIAFSEDHPGCDQSRLVVHTLLVKPHKYCPPLNKAINCDVLIVGGGFSGISAAAEFLGKWW